MTLNAGPSYGDANHTHLIEKSYPQDANTSRNPQYRITTGSNSDTLQVVRGCNDNFVDNPVHNPLQLLPCRYQMRSGVTKRSWLVPRTQECLKHIGAMNTLIDRDDVKEIASVGERIYAEKFRADFEARFPDQYAVIDIETAQAVVRLQPEDAVVAAGKKFGDTMQHLIHIGFPSAVQLGFFYPHADLARPL